MIRRWEEDRVQDEGTEGMIYSLRLRRRKRGGPPTRELVEAAFRCRDLEGAPRAVFEGPEAYFRKLEERGCENVFSGELYLAWHRGTYTAQAKTKLGVRRARVPAEGSGVLEYAAGAAGAFRTGGAWKRTRARKAGSGGWAAYPVETASHAGVSRYPAGHGNRPGASGGGRGACRGGASDKGTAWRKASLSWSRPCGADGGDGKRAVSSNDGNGADAAETGRNGFLSGGPRTEAFPGGRGVPPSERSSHRTAEQGRPGAQPAAGRPGRGMGSGGEPMNTFRLYGT